MVSKIKKLESPARNYGEEEEGVDKIDIGGDIEEEEKNPFYEEDENGEEFLQ